MPAIQQHSVWTGYRSGTSGPVPLGYVMIPDDREHVVVATAANRTRYGRNVAAAGIAISAAGNDELSVELQTVGPCPPEITKLGPGEPSDLRVGDDGRLERAVIEDDDIYAGKCDADGWAYLNLAGARGPQGLPGEQGPEGPEGPQGPPGSGAAPGGSVGDLMVHGPDGTLVPHVAGKATLQATEIEAKGDPNVPIRSSVGSVKVAAVSSVDRVICLLGNNECIRIDGIVHARKQTADVGSDEPMSVSWNVSLRVVQDASGNLRFRAVSFPPDDSADAAGLQAGLDIDSDVDIASGKTTIILRMFANAVTLSYGWELRVQYQGWIP